MCISRWPARRSGCCSGNHPISPAPPRSSGSVSTRPISRPMPYCDERKDDPMNRGRWLLLLAGVAWLVGCRSTRGGPLVVRGTVEVPEIDLSATVPARVASVRPEEGAEVQAGDTIAILSQAELPSSLEAQRARVANAQARLRDLEAGARPAELERAQAEVAAARAETQRATKDAERMRALAAQ